MDPKRIQDLFLYDRETGVVTRRISVKGQAKGRTVGTRDHGGYLVCSVDGKRLYLHRIAFVLATGQWPQGLVDHINGDRVDNRWLNLRDVSSETNVRNRRVARKDKVHGALIGTKKVRDRWQARISANGRSFNLGGFATEEEAHAAYIAAKRRVHMEAFA